ncbi:hypothetical protein EVJ58_g4773 [Rhodofomes roseus]|uniref:Uncharacterized protein n=1 Tax=Rhodofomes roseus TaxID=34475 RepID=A0A4Y9YEQ7_9APHY|nr:hypothetical protein EVJ58_g4773 [Rhodofomes roseus]
MVSVSVPTEYYCPRHLDQRLLTSPHILLFVLCHLVAYPDDFRATVTPDEMLTILQDLLGHNIPAATATSVGPHHPFGTVLALFKFLQ